MILCRACAAFFAIALLGCGDQPSGKVSGNITVDGISLTSGVVTFHSAGSAPNAIVSTAVVEGKYSIEKIAPGNAKIGVQSLKPSQPGKNPDGTIPIAPKGPFVPVPVKFKEPKDSGLTYEVKHGAQTHDIEIKTK